MSMLGVYVDRPSPVHRLPAGLKLLVLAVAAGASVWLGRWWHVALAAGAVALLYAVSRVPWCIAWRQVRPVLLLVLAIGVFQVLVAGWERAVVIGGGIVCLVALAALVSLTTRTDDLVAAVVRACAPLRRFGVRPERLGLLVSLGVRSVPVVVELARQVREAQVARGASARPVAFLVPLVVRSLRHADRVSEALVARGYED